MTKDPLMNKCPLAHKYALKRH